MFAALNSFQTGGAIPVFVSEVFSTTLYTGNGSTQTITNNIDVSNKGGLIWAKARSGTFATADHLLQDSARGFGDSTGLASSTTSAQFSYSGLIQSVSTTGFTTGSNPYSNASATDYVAWTFREQPKFFDVVTYTGNGTTQNIAHSLGSTPGCIIVKRTDATENWGVYHRSIGATGALRLNLTSATSTLTAYWNDTEPTSTQFTVGSNSQGNASGGTYVAYLFAHNAGGFGLTGSDNVITCGNFTSDAGGNATINLGYEPQWLLYKTSASNPSDWRILDNMRDWSYSNARILAANLSDAETSIGSETFYPTETGFTFANANLASSTPYIYIAINAN
jgi:hypothetical protein